MTEQDDTPKFHTLSPDSISVGDIVAALTRTHERLSRLQAVAALDENFGYRPKVSFKSISWQCRHCGSPRGIYEHADGCPVGLYEREAPDHEGGSTT